MNAMFSSPSILVDKVLKCESTRCFKLLATMCRETLSFLSRSWRLRTTECLRVTLVALQFKICCFQRRIQSFTIVSGELRRVVYNYVLEYIVLLSTCISIATTLAYCLLSLYRKLSLDQKVLLPVTKRILLSD